MHPPKVIISGGGTGGHIFPAIAIARAIKAKYPEADILFVGAKGRMEMEKVPKAGFPIEGLWISGLQRRLTVDNLSFPLKVLSSLLKANRIVSRFKPDIAIGVGGYASGPLLRVAAARGIPSLIQEQNSFPGITNRLLAGKVNRICVAYEGLERWFPVEKIVLTGNPVRSEVLGPVDKAKALAHFGLNPDRPVLLVSGGSLGARTINESIESGLDLLAEAGIQVIWQTGKTYFERARSLGNHRVKVFEFIYEMDLAYAAADIIVSRAGAMSISELCVIGKPCILVPSPNVAEDHQTKNARALSDRGAAVLVKDAEAREVLTARILELMEDETGRASLSSAIRLMALPDATERILREVEALLSQRK
jgi:UDP-N-acetylglucosamine--N-acetylmuramyl-(pentapeptide) pyrophosphoryl-undecaprenol N-acetylglucosamine transferase